ncbi:hypothetical protein AVEN_87646-1 [Araneus ventricosus]|uniref:Uncharacterized protein n=1 Tax=Araneus ventricosus TaxID=182803 RepID=A0A4Y2W2X7_ARAVE|nr:hypothetical protein AVEN_85028-1 [Araneus ventricosus]GBO30874.1 hypothetical protein AVEN_87646-1 [Araneus ventricosus]
MRILPMPNLYCADPSKEKKPNPLSCGLNLEDPRDGPSKRDEENNSDLIMFDDYDIPLHSKSKNEFPKATTRVKKSVPSLKAMRENGGKAANYMTSASHMIGIFLLL